MKKLIYSFLLVTALVVTIARAQTILSYSVLPANPTDNDAVSLRLETEFRYGMCSLVAYNVSFNGNTIYVNAYYETGGFTFICPRTDTLNIGSNLHCGEYFLEINT